jgi:leucyl-tRNA synthetase
MNISGTYDFSAIEKKWQKYWDENKTYKVSEDATRPKYYVLDMFPYPSGSGLHVGHVEGYTATDIIARYKRMCGYNVLHPMGWDAFGLPAEQYAIKTSTHPLISTTKNINNYRLQIKSIGKSVDWLREINTTDPKYYRWTQWIFLKLFEKGLAYESHSPVNWCPKLGTVLADEEVIDGKSEVGSYPVEKKSIRQWVLKITDYAERLLNDIDELDWPESTKEMQRNWIGKSNGAKVSISVANNKNLTFDIFTTRPDTLFGMSYCALAPEHPLIDKITSYEKKDSVEDYRYQALAKSDLMRLEAKGEKTGVFTGAYAINPVNKEKVPIFVTDYILINYGTGAIMAVPGHDARDHEFAKKYKLKIKRVIEGGKKDINEEAFTGSGKLINSDFINGLNTNEAIENICTWLEEKKIGKKTTTYRLRDWIFSRQRYWGEPFPIIFDKNNKASCLKEEDLPVTLPAVNDFKPSTDGNPPLSKAKKWVNLEKDDKKYQRETNIMPQWAGSCWYYLRYLDPNNDKKPWDPKKENYWMPVDLYVGGVEHANLHLLYARFWHKVLFDLGYVSTKEPFKKVVHPGLILGSNNEKMSKSRGNVVLPDEIIKEWGSDALRLFEMFLGPLEQAKPWQTKGILGISRFLNRFWKFYICETGLISPNIQAKEDSIEVKKEINKTIKKVSNDLNELKFNTAIATMMEFLNFINKDKKLSNTSARALICLLHPFAPHLSEEIWERMGHKELISFATWPTYDEKYTLENTSTIAVMINGKLRGTVELANDITKDKALELAKSQNFLTKYLNGKIIKEIYIPKKIINIVIK